MSDSAQNHNSNISVLHREIFSYARTREYFERDELRTMTGQPVAQFPAVIVKELFDNGLDAAEYAGVAPVIVFNVWRRRRDVIIEVKDNGDGIPPEAVAGIIDLNVRTSNKAAYRSPTRGLQGNAAKTILGIPCALGSRFPLVIEACGKKHVIRPHVDPGGNVRVDHDTHDVDDQGGTRVALSLPADACNAFDARHWARAFALFNPHAFVHFGDRPVGGKHATLPPTKKSQMYKRSFQATVDYPGGDWKKFGPRDLISASWYDLASFQRLIFSYVEKARQKARQDGRDLPLREFVTKFPGLTRSDKAKIVTDQFPLIDRLSDFEKHPAMVSRLLEVMQAESRAPAPDKLGCIGRAHFELRFRRWFGVKRFWYKKTSGVAGDIPFVFEVAIATTHEPGGLFHGVNFSPTFTDFLGHTSLTTEKIQGYGAKSFLSRAHVFPKWEGDRLPFHAVAAVHLVTPVTQPLDKGKSKLVIPSEMAESITDMLWGASKDLHKEGERREKDAAAQERKEQERIRLAEKGSRDIPHTQIIDKVIPEALKHATGGTTRVSTHTLFYSARPVSQKYTDRLLTPSNFEQKLLPPYQLKHSEISKWLYREPRGILYEPHTGKAIPLGTREVEDYVFPAWLYNKILFVEKKGLWPTFEDGKIAEMFDMAIVVGEGYASEACRVLFKHADANQDYQIFYLTDADPFGYNIGRVLGAETERMPGHNVEVIPLGLILKDALDLGLSPEKAVRKKAIPSGLKLTPLEREYFTGRQVGAKRWIYQRVELNAFTGPGLLKYVVDQLNDHRIVGKVIPPNPQLGQLVHPLYQDALTKLVRDKINAQLDIEKIAGQVALDFSKAHPIKNARTSIKAAFQDDPFTSWQKVIEQNIGKQLTERDRALQQAISAALRSAGLL